MLTISISVNAQPIYTRTAVNRGIDREGTQGHQDQEHWYHVDDGSWIAHRRSEGAVELARKMLDTIRERP